MKLSVLIPVYNEKQYIEKLLDSVLNTECEKEVIVVDDHSDDGTAQFLRHIRKKGNVKVIFHKKNLGKAEAVKTGMKEANGQYIIIQDADDEYYPEDYSKLLCFITESNNVAVYGNRFHSGFVSGMSLKQKIGNLIMTSMFNILMRQKLRDMETCYKMFPRDCIVPENIESRGFGIDPEITVKLIKSGIKIKEVPIRYSPRPYSAGKKIKLKDAIITLSVILKYSMWY